MLDASLTEAWRAEFERQATPEMQERLYRAARRRLRMFAGRTRHVNDADVDDIVNAALLDTLDGTLSWSPDAKPLESHLLDSIAYRVRDQARFKSRHRHEEYEEDVTGEPLASRTIEDATDGYDLRVIAGQVIPEIRQRAGEDGETLALLELYRDGVTERAEVIRESSMSPAQYDNAIRRLRRLTKQMPKPTREAALEALT